MYVIIFHNFETNPEVIKHLIGVNWKRFCISVLEVMYLYFTLDRDTARDSALSKPRPHLQQPFLFARAGFVANVKTQTNSIHSENILTLDRQLCLISFVLREDT